MCHLLGFIPNYIDSSLQVLNPTGFPWKQKPLQAIHNHVESYHHYFTSYWRMQNLKVDIDPPSLYPFL